MERLVGRRFNDLDEIKKEIEKITHKKIGTIFESESDRLEDCDFMIDYEFELFDIYNPVLFARQRRALLHNRSLNAIMLSNPIHRVA